ncbi:MAG: flagellar hook-basal body complex protein FliE [Candidatus Margulisiibacteriota bacterium]
MVEAISPVDAEFRLAQLLGDDILAPPSSLSSPSQVSPVVESGTSQVSFSGNPFEDMLSQAVESLNGVSQSEAATNQLVDRYLRGEVDLQSVMVSQSKTTILVQFAVTAINAAVTSFKEITQMQV